MIGALYAQDRVLPGTWSPPPRRRAYGYVHPLRRGLHGLGAIIHPSGGDDTAALQAALDAGGVVEMGPGTYQLGPVHISGGTQLNIDSGAILTDIPGYGQSDCMLNIAASNVVISAAGAQLQMPHSYAASIADGSQYRHGVRIGGGGASGVHVSGLAVSQAGGDGFYVRECTNVLLDGVSGSACQRNGCSITGQVDGVTVQNSDFSNQQDLSGAGIADGIDVEPNVPGDYIRNVSILNCTFRNNQQRGLFISLYFLNSSSETATVNVSGCSSSGSGVEDFGVNTDNGGTIHLTGGGNSFDISKYGGVPGSVPPPVPTPVVSAPPPAAPPAQAVVPSRPNVVTVSTPPATSNYVPGSPSPVVMAAPAAAAPSELPSWLPLAAAVALGLFVFRGVIK